MILAISTYRMANIGLLSSNHDLTNIFFNENITRAGYTQVYVPAYVLTQALNVFAGFTSLMQSV